MFRRVLFAVSVISGAVAYGRKMADRTIDKKIAEEIDAAKEMALAELDREIDQVLRQRLRRYALTLLIKASLIASVYLAYMAGAFGETIFRAGAAGLLAAYVGHDLVSAAPYLPRFWRLLRQYGFNGKKALREYVAGVAFERAYLEAHSKLDAGMARSLVAVSNYSRDEVSMRIANAISDLTGAVSYDRVKARGIFVAVKAVSLMMLYALFLLLILKA